MKFVGEIPDNIFDKKNNEIVSMIAFYFYRNISINHLKHFTNIEAYLNASIAKLNIKNLRKDKLWILLILVIQKVNLKLYNLDYTIEHIDEVINNIKYIETNQLLNLLDNISYLLVQYNKSLSISLIANKSKYAFQKEYFDGIERLIYENISENDICDDIYECYKFIKNKNFVKTFDKRIILVELIFYDVLTNTKLNTDIDRTNVLIQIFNKVELDEEKFNEIKSIIYNFDFCHAY